MIWFGGEKMNKLTIFPLFFNVIIFMFQVIFGEGTWVSIGNIAGIDVGFWVDKWFSLGAFIGILTAIIFLGFGILNSGFSDRSIQITLELVGYVATWGLTSLFTFPIFTSIEYFGLIIYWVLTISFGIGVFLDISQEGNENA